MKRAMKYAAILRSVNAPAQCLINSFNNPSHDFQCYWLLVWMTALYAITWFTILYLARALWKVLLLLQLELSDILVIRYSFYMLSWFSVMREADYEHWVIMLIVLTFSQIVALNCTALSYWAFHVSCCWLGCVCDNGMPLCVRLLSTFCDHFKNASIFAFSMLNCLILICRLCINKYFQNNAGSLEDWSVVTGVM